MDLAQVAEAYKHDRYLRPLVIDDDYVSVTRVDDEHDPGWLQAQTVYQARPEELLDQALDLLGIPHQRA